MRFSAFMASLAALCWTALCGQIDNGATRSYVDSIVAASTVGMVTQGMSNVNLGTNLSTSGDVSIGGDIHVDTIMPHGDVNPTIYMAQGWMLDAAGVDSIDWGTRVLYNSLQHQVASWEYQMLLATNGDYRLSWYNNTLYGNWTNTGSLTVHGGGNVVTNNQPEVNFGITHAEYIRPPNASTLPMIEMLYGSMYDTSTNESLHWVDRDLLDANQLRALSWSARWLTTSNDINNPVIDWQNRKAYGNWTFPGSLTSSNTVTASNVVQTAGGWDDFVFPANALGIFAAADVTSLPVSNAIVFATTCTTNLSNGDHVWATMQMPHGWVTNTMISPHVHFVQEHADQTNMWFLRYKWYNIGDAIPATWIELNTSTNKVVYTSGAVHQLAEFDDIDGTHGMSSILDIKLYRKGTTGTGAVMMKQFDVHYQRNSFGSDTEYSKSF